MQDLKVSVIQSDLAWEDIESNLNNFENKIKRSDLKTDLIILPEMFNTGFSINPDKIAEHGEGKTLQWMKQQAEANNCVITGSIPVYEKGKYYNRLIWMKPDSYYLYSDKRHLFTMGEEHTVYDYGNKKIIPVIKGWKILPLVCYDLRFPVWSKNKYRDNSYEYDALIYVANWPKPRRHVWKTLLKARALENLAYVIGVNRIGTDGRNLEYSGDSSIIDFLGTPVAECTTGKEEIISYTLNYKELQRFRDNFNVGADWDEFIINI